MSHNHTISSIAEAHRWQHAGHAIIVDARDDDEYHDAHIAGARHLPLRSLITTRDGIAGMAVPDTELQRVLEAAGIGSDDRIICYDGAWGMIAARVVWTLHQAGHDAATVLDGGIDAWVAAGLPIDAQPGAARAVRFAPRAPHPASAGVDAGWIRAHQHDTGVQLVDTRSAAEYARGHIPGAVHWDWNDGTPADGSGYFRGDHALRDELAARGIVADREIVTYCHSGVRAAHTYALLRAIGYPRVRLYDGSWLEWSTLHGAHA
jgi:thiosulfate/3-mercaptopyruvate sulfurtransferase